MRLFGKPSEPQEKEADQPVKAKALKPSTSESARIWMQFMTAAIAANGDNSGWNTNILQECAKQADAAMIEFQRRYVIEERTQSEQDLGPG